MFFRDDDHIATRTKFAGGRMQPRLYVPLIVFK